MAANILLVISNSINSPRHVKAGRDDIVTNTDIFGVKIPDSRIAREITQLVRDTESDVLFHHSTRVYFWAALTEAD